MSGTSLYQPGWLQPGFWVEGGWREVKKGHLKPQDWHSLIQCWLAFSVREICASRFSLRLLPRRRSSIQSGLKLAIFSMSPVSFHLAGWVTPLNFCSFSSPFPEFPFPLSPSGCLLVIVQGWTPPPGSLPGCCICVSCPSFMYPQHLYLTHFWHIWMFWLLIHFQSPSVPTYHPI